MNPTLPRTAQFIPEEVRRTHAFSDLGDTGMLWLINRSTFNPRGFHISLRLGRAGSAGPAIGWRLLGTGREPWTGDADDEAMLAAANAFLAGHTAPARLAEPGTRRIGGTR